MKLLAGIPFFLLTICTLIMSTTQASAESSYEPGLYAEIQTNQGLIVAKLFFEETPMTVANFVGLAEGKIANKAKGEGKPYYDGLIFHRVIPGFMIQGGDPQGTGTGGPGYKFPDEIVPTLKHTKPGIFSMANAGRGTNGSQFFITVAATPWLDGKHTVFGEVIKGMDVVNQIVGVETGAQDRPKDKQVMESVKIVRVGEAAEAFEASQEQFDSLVEESASLEDKRRKAALEAREKAAMADAEKLTGWVDRVRSEGKKTDSGIEYYVVTQGAGGEKPKMGQMVSAHYSGYLLNGKKFDSSYDRNDPIKFAVGTGRVIPGWDETLFDMVKGEKRHVILPADLAYGSRGAGGVIPPNSTLFFEIELVDFK